MEYNTSIPMEYNTRDSRPHISLMVMKANSLKNAAKKHLECCQIPRERCLLFLCFSKFVLTQKKLKTVLFVKKHYIIILCKEYDRTCRSMTSLAVMESRDLVSVSRPVFLSLCLEGLRSCHGLEGFRSRSRALRLETFAQVIFHEVLQGVPQKMVLKKDYSKFSRSKRSVSKLSLLLCYLRDGENNLPSTAFKIYAEFNKKM